VPLARVRDAGVDLVRADAAPKELVISRDRGVAAWCPHASASPYQLRIAHDEAGARFDQTDDASLAQTALAVRDALALLRAAIGDVPYNLVVPTAPRDASTFHWYVEIVPRVSLLAGFEQVTGILVNTVAPEQAAEILREVHVQ
jgi:UDPglucose--hexose-1-phosphate uridylyltransferase